MIEGPVAFLELHRETYSSGTHTVQLSEISSYTGSGDSQRTSIAMKNGDHFVVYESVNQIKKLILDAGRGG